MAEPRFSWFRLCLIKISGGSAVSHVLIETQDRILTIRLHRPDKKNALTQAMYADAGRALKSAQADSAVRVVLIAGQPDCFCAGNDVACFWNAPLSGTDNPVLHFMEALSTIDKPVIAAPSGVAVGIGVTRSEEHTSELQSRFGISYA